MRLNDFIRELTALCKEELNPEVVDEFGSKCTQVEYVDGAIMLTFEYDGGDVVMSDGPEDINFVDIEESLHDAEIEADLVTVEIDTDEEPEVKVVTHFTIVPDGNDAA